MRRARTVPIILTATCLTWGSAAADVWIQAEPASPEPGRAVSLRLFEGPPFEGTEVSRTVESAGALQRLWKSGRSNLKLPSDRGYAAEFVADKPGVNMLVYASAAGDDFCKAILVVGRPGEGDPLRWSEVGHTLEIVPQSDPVQLARKGGTLEVQVLFDREPLAGTRVRAVPEAAPEGGAKSAATDEIGVVRIGLDRPGRWLVRVAHTGRCEGCGAGSPTSFTATLLVSAGP